MFAQKAVPYFILSFIIESYRRGGEKTMSDTVVYKLLDYFRWVELRMAQKVCDFVRLIGEIRLLSSSFGLGGHFRKKPILVLRSYFYRARKQSARGLFYAEK